MRIIIAIIGFLLILICFWVFTSGITRIGGPRVYSIKNFDEKNIGVLEKNLSLKFPLDTTVENLSIVGGKDLSVFLKFKFQNDKLSEFLDNIQFDTKRKKVKQEMINHPDLPWWNMQISDVELVLSRMGSFTYLIVMQPKGGDNTIYMRSDGGPKGISEDLWKVIQTEGRRGKLWD